MWKEVQMKVNALGPWICQQVGTGGEEQMEQCDLESKKGENGKNKWNNMI